MDEGRAECAILALVRVYRLCCVLIALGCFSCTKKIDQQLWEAIRTFGDSSLKDDDIEVENIQQMGNHAVAEITIKTAVKLAKKEGRWIIEEVRLGDRRWEKTDHILAVINEKRDETTRRQLDLISRGIQDYNGVHGQVPQASDFMKLIDILTPEHLDQILYIDAWSNPFIYRFLSTSTYDLRSSGPDGKKGTDDDLTTEIH